MATGSRTRATLIALALAAAAASTAGEPGFDCARASGQVEQLICADTALAASDPTAIDLLDRMVATAGSGGVLAGKVIAPGWGRQRGYRPD